MKDKKFENKFSEAANEAKTSNKLLEDIFEAIYRMENQKGGTGPYVYICPEEYYDRMKKDYKRLVKGENK